MIRMTMRGVRQTGNDVLFIVSSIRTRSVSEDLAHASGLCSGVAHPCLASFASWSCKLPVLPCSFHVALLLVILGQRLVGRPVSLIELERQVQQVHPLLLLFVPQH